MPRLLSSFFFFNDTATTEIYTLSLHDALPISARAARHRWLARAVQAFGRRPDRSLGRCPAGARPAGHRPRDRKSTRLNSSHTVISYAVFCLKKKKHIKDPTAQPVRHTLHRQAL